MYRVVIAGQNNKIIIAVEAIYVLFLIMMIDTA